MRYVVLIVVLGAMAIGLLYMKKKMQNRQFTQNSFKNIIQVVDGVQVSIGNNMYLTKVGEEYILVAMGQSGVSMIKLEQTEFVDPKEKFDSILGNEMPVDTISGLKEKIKGRMR